MRNLVCPKRHNSISTSVNDKLKDTDKWVITTFAREVALHVSKEGSPIRYSSTFLKIKSRLASATALAILISLSSAGCSNSSLPTSANTLNAGLTSLSPKTSTSSGNSVFTLSEVVFSTSNPKANFDLIGDGTGAIGQSCTASTAGATDPTLPSTCVCNYSYIRASGASESQQSPSIYRENDLLRCSYTIIPSDVTYVDVSIFVSTSHAYSSTQRFNFSGALGGLSLANSTSFNSIRRYQCKDTIVIDGVFSGTNIYDPIQSEDPLLSYPLNFYTGNMGGAFASFIANTANVPASSGAGWNCPTIPNDTSAGLDLSVYSVDRDSGSNTIYPPTATSDRSTFYLAKQATGAFAIPVNAFIAPFTMSSTTIGSTNLPPIGYGAAPIPLSNGTETCPDSSVTIPTGYKWVKVWLFRASLSDRKFAISTKLQQAGPVSCNPGTWDGSVANAGNFATVDVFPDCRISQNIPNSSGTVLADRVLAGAVSTTTTGGNGACISPTDPSNAGTNLAGRSAFSTGATACASPNALWAEDSTGSCLNSFALGSDLYSFQGSRPIPNNCTNASDQLGLCSALSSHSSYPASDNNLGIGSLDGGVSRYDYLFVVSPTTVNALDFKNTTPVSFIYTPYRFYSPTDCISGDPDSPASATDCLASKMIHYGVDFTDITTDGDAPAGTAGRLPVFPVCALQQGP